MREHVTWASPAQDLEAAARQIGVLLEDRKYNLAAAEIAKAQVALGELLHHMMTRNG